MESEREDLAGAIKESSAGEKELNIITLDTDQLDRVFS